MLDPTVAFALKAPDYDLDCVGAVVVNHHRDLNVRAALQDAPDGVYVTSDADEIRTLDTYAPVKRVPVPTLKPQDDKPAAGKAAAAKSDGKE